MKLKFAVAMTFALACTGSAFCDTFNFTGTNHTLDHSATYTAGTSSITASAFNLDGTNRLLYGKNGAGSEKGIGIAGTPDNEITKSTFVQLDLSALTASSYYLSIGSTQDDEAFSVYYSNEAGVLGTLYHDYTSPNADPFFTALMMTLSGDRFLSIIADGNQGAANNGAGDVLLDSLTTNVTPEPNSLLLLGTGILGMGGMVRRKLSV